MSILLLQKEWVVLIIFQRNKNKKMTKQDFIREAIKYSAYAMRKNLGGPFGAVIVKDNKIISRGYNSVTSSNNPTAHAEMMAIQKACKKLKTFDLSGCEIYTSCEPCPMCLSAIYWAHLDKMYFANTRRDAAKIDFDDEFLYKEIALPIEKRKLKIEKLKDPEAIKIFNEWKLKEDKIKY